jgi:DNA-binding CsgD family transcriptional regulator
LRRASLEELDPVRLLIAMLRPDGARGLLHARHADALSAVAALRLEHAVRALAEESGYRRSETRVLRLFVAGCDRAAAAELLGVTRNTIDGHCRAIVQKRDVPRCAYVVHDVFRLACAIPSAATRAPRLWIQLRRRQGG